MRILAAAWVLLAAAAAGVVPVAGQTDEWFDAMGTAMDAGGRGHTDTVQAVAERQAVITAATAEVSAQGKYGGTGPSTGYAKVTLKRERKEMKAMAKDKREAGVASIIPCKPPFPKTRCRSGRVL